MGELCGGRILFRLIGQPLLQRFHAVKRFAGHGGFLDRDAVGFLDADRELQRVDRVETEAIGAKEERFGLDFPRRNSKHAIIDQQLPHIVEGDLGHPFKKACPPEIVEGN
jgi:hypothetical protein